jgi:DHA1 family tetracycline resistance protein-like MFS transporter
LNKALVVILAAVMLDAIGIGLIFPILPALLRDVGHTSDISILLGVMLALYSACQFLFSPILGVLSDRFGRRPVLLVSLAGAAIDYLIMAFAPHLWMLVIGRAIAGVTSANMAVATAYITDITPEEQRAQRFGMFHAMFGIGFVIGPVLGGLLGDYWIRAPFIAAAVLNGLNFLLALFVLPESRPGDRSTPFAFAQLNPLKPLAWAFGLRQLLPMIAAYFLLVFVSQVYGTVWALYGQDAFQWNGLMVGLSLGAYGLCHALVQALLPGPMSKWLGESNTILLGLLGESVALIAAAIASQGWVIFAVMPLFALGGVGNPALQSLMTQQADADSQGRLQGVLASVVSIATIFGPLFFAAIYFAISTSWPGLIWVVCVALYVLAIPLFVRLRRGPTAPQPA